ncbi:MAG: lipid II flippase MurJ, partial [Anaerolineae bacterium]
VPTSLYDLIIGGMVSSALVPVFSDYAGKKQRDELWGVLSTVLSVATVLLLILVVLVEVFAPQIGWLVGANEFDDPALTATAVRLMRMATPTVLFLSIGSILTGALFALRRFSVPAFIGAIFNGTIVVVALLRPAEIDSLVYGMLLGSLLQIVVQWIALRDAKIRWQFDIRHPAVRRILRLYAPIVAGLLVNQLAVALSYNLATRTGDQSISYMKFATTLYQFPLGLVVTALSVATLPTLARQAQGQLIAFKNTLADGLRLVITLILPATAGLFALAVPIVALLFQHGEFTAGDTE